MTAGTMRWLALILATALISMLFFNIARPFLTALLMAALGAEMARPLRRRMLTHCGQRESLASVLTLTLVIVLVVVPVLALGYMAASQAAGLAGSMRVFAQQLAEGHAQHGLPDWLPMESWLEEQIREWWPTILEKLGELATAAAAYFVSLMSAMTRGAARMFLDLFIFIYALYFFLGAKTPVLATILSYSGLDPATQERLFERMVSITRATLKGTLVIATVQGLMGGAGFWVAGIDGVAFWTVVMVVMAMIPAVGASSVIVIGAIILMFQGHVFAGLLLAGWGALVVGSADNVLRPILVGRDTQLGEILILVSTLGGLGVFGLPGLVLGPVMAGLFVTIWKTLRDAMQADEATEETAC